MAQIVINIPDFLYKQILKKHVSKATIARAFQNCVVLPKGHGRLIDADKANKKMQYYHGDCEKTSVYTRLGFETAMNVVNDAPTIIEADKEGKE